MCSATESKGVTCLKPYVWWEQVLCKFSRHIPWTFQCIPANSKLPVLYLCALGSFSELWKASRLTQKEVLLVPGINTPGNSPQPMLWKLVYKCTSPLALGPSIPKCVSDTAFHRTEVCGSWCGNAPCVDWITFLLEFSVPPKQLPEPKSLSQHLLPGDLKLRQQSQGNPQGMWGRRWTGKSLRDEVTIEPQSPL